MSGEALEVYGRLSRPPMPQPQPPTHGGGPTIKDIINIAASWYGVSTDDLTGPNRRQHITERRQLTMAACRHITAASYPAIGVAFGNRDHTTVIHAVRKVDSDPQRKIALEALVNAIERRQG